MIEIYKNTKAYIACPARTTTGGPELLHQLVHHLINDLNIEAYMYYFPNNIDNPIHHECKLYNNPFSMDIEDSKNNIFIVPEIMKGIDLLSNYNNVRKSIWWLSVDNYYLSKIFNFRNIFRFKESLLFERIFNKICKILFGKPMIDTQGRALKKMKLSAINIPQANFYLAQSCYAKIFLIKRATSKYKIYYLSDYLNEDFLNLETDIYKKQDLILYNPKKGYEFTRKIIKYSNKLGKNFKFIPIENMTRIQVIELLQKAKIYIDFGNHPGKDRMPREAAILKCCVLVGKRGSAAFYEDVSIPEKYKFKYSEKQIPAIIDKIEDCISNYGERIKDFAEYIKIIKNELEKFKNDLKKIFIKVE